MKIFNAKIEKTDLVIKDLEQPDNTIIHGYLKIYYVSDRGTSGQISFKFQTLPKLFKSLGIEYYDELVGLIIKCKGDNSVGAKCSKVIQGAMSIDNWIEADY